MQVRQLKSRGPGPRLVCDLVTDKSETSFRQIKKSRTWSETWSPTR